ncbi:xanthine dehydrogenase accessory protein XdhC [Litoreibacter arenae]|uniref:XdhC protein (Assists in molybdopterin insertion into xanthine dehydrogenase) n=1 Tax=Litoreibacter arenae DSM 19593 TaxID=1123360 RepID=S9QL28_9RHOB|nr:xanthine dehydrogenase accessory protein XdhC [Litoreibacter arenae]EPX80318.1 XdhC protein (assists in molybdopterin insertion into xanthine dehydrogenase) [Litoreibacter arenae DSM 19593]
MSVSEFLANHRKVILVRLTEVRGSSPREAGAQMFVASDGLHGTIGGGQLEYMAIDKARAMLRSGREAEVMDVPLGPEIGQCCGGRVVVRLAQMTDADRMDACARDARDVAERPHVYILGAGHVGRALARFCQLLPVRCILIDARQEELSLTDAKVETRLSAMAEADIRDAPAGSAFVVLTHDHALDFLLTSEALDRGDAAYVGLIGSATKRVKFSRYHASHSDTKDISGLTCPIGANASADKRPEIIAAFVAAEVMTCLTKSVDQKTLATTQQKNPAHIV